MIRQGQRVFVVGMTGEGKSQLSAHLFAVHTGQRILIDVQDHYELGPDAGDDAIVADKVSAIDWRARTIRYVPRRMSAREYDELYRAIYSQGNVLVWLDEAEGPTSPQSTPRFIRRVVKQGRKRGITHIATTQRPVGVERSIINQSEHAMVFRMVDPDDIAALSYRMGMSPRELSDVLRQLPKHGFLYHELGGEAIKQMPPLPAGIVRTAQRVVTIPN